MKVIEVKDFTRGVCVGIVVSRYHAEVSEELLKETTDRLQELEVSSDNITVVHVPGVVEIPLAAKHLAATKKFNSIIALGVVTQDGNDNFEHICNQVSEGCQQVSLQSDIPVTFGVIMMDNVDQAKQHVGGKKGYRGRDAAESALEMVSVLKQIN